jgi:hypothetical protein
MSGIDANTLLCLHCDGSNGGTAFPDTSQYNRAITVTGNANTDTTQFKFGTASCRVGIGSNDWIGDAGLNYSFGVGDFTIDMQVRFNSTASQFALFSDSNNSEQSLEVVFLTSNNIRVQYNAGTLHNFSWVPSTSTWYHFALERKANVTNVYVDGTALAGSFTATDNLAAMGLQFGQRATGSTQMNGWQDEIRISNVARYGGNFTAPISPYSSFAYYPPMDSRRRAYLRR